MPDTRAPTRVSNACDRCRRNKQRCDADQPCLRCVQAGVSCTKPDLPPPHKRARILRRAQSNEADGTPVQTNFGAPTSAPRSNDYEVELDFRGQLSPVPKVSLGPSLRSLSASTSINGQEGQSRHSAVAAIVQAIPSVRSEESALADLGGSESAVDITKKILGYAHSPTERDRATFAIPGGGPTSPLVSTNPTSRPLLPVSQIIGIDLPERQLCGALIDAYFCTVHWFSLVVYEPRFRANYTRIIESGLANSSDKPFLFLLLMILAMGCWYGPGLEPSEIAPAAELADMRKAYLRVIRSDFMDLMDEDCLEFVQLCILLGSYWLYWGRPKSSFSILGAATKSAQALGLHRDQDKRFSAADAEERKRIWWTIYTWDRFATTIYGRPLGINDKDCNVAMPTSFPEDINFSLPDEKTPVCLSPYQIQLNRVYQIASPLLENIYGVRFSTDPHLRSEMPAMISRIDRLMRDWQENLPLELNLEKKGDISLTTSTEAKLHRLQALSLQLTFDNLMIVIHRPLLADQTHRRFHPGHPSEEAETGSSTATRSSHRNSFEQCLSSALRISRIQQSYRNLLALARRTHLVSFIGMNLFTSSVVLFIRALSDTLSDIAQEAKRGITRNLKMLKLLSGDGSLSMQCSKILEDLVQLVFDKEKEEMLRSHPSEDEVALFVPTRRGSVMEQTTETPRHGGYSGMAWAATGPPGADLASSSAATPSEGGFLLHQTIDSLQKVFKDAQTPKAPATTITPVGAELSGQPIHDEAMQEFPSGGNRPEQPGRLFDGANIQAEDLGQFWLWNLDPYRDDFSNWHFDNEFYGRVEDF